MWNICFQKGEKWYIILMKKRASCQATSWTVQGLVCGFWFGFAFVFKTTVNVPKWNKGSLEKKKVDIWRAFFLPSLHSSFLTFLFWFSYWIKQYFVPANKEKIYSIPVETRTHSSRKLFLPAQLIKNLLSLCSEGFQRCNLWNHVCINHCFFKLYSEYSWYLHI